MNPPGWPASATTSRTPTRVNQAPRQPANPSFIRRNLDRLPPSFWKGLAQYIIGFGLLGFIIALYWDPKPGKPTDEQKALSLVVGSAADVEAQRAGTRPGLVEAFSQPINPWPLALACVLWCISLLITFVRWYILVRAQDLPFTVRNAIRLGLVSYYFNSILPGSVGGDILKAVAVAREQSRRTVAVATIVIDRVIGLWALAWLVALAGGVFWALGNPLLLGNEALKMIVRVTAGIVVGSAAVWSLMGLLSPERSDAIASWLDRLPKIGGSLAELWRACWMYRRKKTAVAIALGMTLVGHAGWVLIFHLCVSAFPEIDSATLPEHVLIVPVGMTAQALFPLPGGVGGGEAAYGWLYTLLGKAAVGGILGCLVQRVIAWGIGFIGYIIYTQMKKELPAEVVVAKEPVPVPAG
jgi:glycosyltransferase 2 family protein